jgi:hypothetical protein
MELMKRLRVVVIVILALLAFQFELGMAVNLSPNLQDVPPLTGSVDSIWGALAKVGGEALTHAVLGSLLTIASLLMLILSLVSRAKSVAIVGILAFAGTALAALTGFLFTLSGFKNDGYSHGMASGFLLAFTMHFVLVCILSVRLRARPQP